MVPSVVSAVKSGATSPRRIAMSAPCMNDASPSTELLKSSRRPLILSNLYLICRLLVRGDWFSCETGEMQASPVVAAFDLDGTLTEGGSVFPWLRFVAGD